jgi:hypothetical protein
MSGKGVFFFFFKTTTERMIVSSFIIKGQKTHMKASLISLSKERTLWGLSLGSARLPYPEQIASHIQSRSNP